MNETFENQNWIVEISVDKAFLGKLMININARNKKTSKVVRKQYKTSLFNIKKTLEQIKNDFGDYK